MNRRSRMQEACSALPKLQVHRDTTRGLNGRILLRHSRLGPDSEIGHNECPTRLSAARPVADSVQSLRYRLSYRRWKAQTSLLREFLSELRTANRITLMQGISVPFSET